MGTPKRVRADSPFRRAAVRPNPLNGCRGKGTRRRPLKQGLTLESSDITIGLNTQLDGPAATVEALARALELHDYRRGSYGETAAHSSRVTQLGLLLAEQMAPELCLEP